MTRQFWGVVLTIVGVMALLQVMHIYAFGLSFWPVVAALIGLAILWSSFRKLSWFGLALGLWIGGMGVTEILHSANITSYTGGDIARGGWPFLLVAIGVSMVFGRKSWRWSYRFNGSDTNRIVGELRMGQSDWTLDNDLRIDQGVGDIKVDLTTAQITEGVHRIYVHAGIGDMVIRVPDDVNVTAKGKVGIGDLEVLGDHRSGFGCVASKTISVPDSPVTLMIDADMGLGECKIVRRPAATIRVIK